MDRSSILRASTIVYSKARASRMGARAFCLANIDVNEMLYGKPGKMPFVMRVR